MTVPEPLATAAVEYRWLLDRGYPVQAASRLVGDRHRLSTDERILLFRGVASTSDSDRRRGRRSDPAPEALVLLDGYNVLFTILHYRLGKTCFLSTDGFLRDAGANYGRVPHDELWAELAAGLAAFLAGRGVVEAYFDAPVSHSAEHTQAFRDALTRAGVPGGAQVAASADGAIVRRVGELIQGGCEPGGFVVATADSAVIDRSPRVWDQERVGLGGPLPADGAGMTKEPRREGRSRATNRPRRDLGRPEPRPGVGGRRPFGPFGCLSARFRLLSRPESPFGAPSSPKSFSKSTPNGSETPSPTRS